MTTKQAQRHFDTLLEGNFKSCLADAYASYSVAKEKAYTRCVNRVFNYCDNNGISPNSVIYGITAFNSHTFTFTVITPKKSWIETKEHIHLFFVDCNNDGLSVVKKY